MRDAEAAAATAKIGNMEMQRSDSIMHGTEAEWQRGSPPPSPLARGNDIHAVAAGLSQRKRGGARFPPISSQDVWRSR